MSFTLYAAVAPGQIQLLGALADILAKTKAHVADTGIAEAELLGSRLAPDMLPFSSQIVFVVAHSIGAIEAVRVGEFVAALSEPPGNLAGLGDLVVQAHTAMKALDPEEVDGFVGRPMRFTGKVVRHEFLAEDYLLSFSQPNFFFHAVTAYDLLRHAGVSLGKRDYLGQLRVKT